MNVTLESMIKNLENEKQRLTNELKRFSKGRLRSNIMDAELHRKAKQNAIVKRSNLAVNNVYAGVMVHKG